MGEGNGQSYQLCLGCGDTGEMVVEQTGGIKVAVPCYYCQVDDDEFPDEDEYPDEEEPDVEYE